MCSGDLPAARSSDPRMVLPSTAITPLQAIGEALHESHEAGVKRLRVEQAEHPADGVVAGNAVLQAQELP